MPHLHVHLSSSMGRLSQLLFILGLGQLVNAASIYQHSDFSRGLRDGSKPQAPVLPFPDLTRRLQEGPTKPTECIYKGEKYLQGERVPTAQPCLNCTCNVPHVLCYLKLCPKVSAPPSGCFAAREVGECCPTLVCGDLGSSKQKDPSDSDLDLRPTFQPTREETIATDQSSTVEDNKTVTFSPLYSNQTDPTFIDDNSANLFSADGSPITNNTAENILTNLESSQTDVTPNVDDISTDIFPTTKVSSTDTAHTTESTPVEIAENVKSSSTDTIPTVESSPITSTETIKIHTTPLLETKPTDEILTVTNSILHTTLTDEGDSLVYISSTQEPGRDYDINMFNVIPGGCMVNGTLYGDGSAMLSSTFCEYCFCIRGKSTCLKPKCNLAIPGCTAYFDNNYSCCPSRYDCSQRIVAHQNSTSALTPVSSTTLPETTAYTGQCIIDGTLYHQGEVVPNRLACHNCYCSDSNVVCEKIKCAPPLEGCQPIIPEGRCCPISYRCDYSSENGGNNNIKGATLNDSALSTDIKGSEIKTIKNYFNGDNTEIRLKGIPHDGESIALLHNVIPIHRRLDEEVHFDENAPMNASGASAVHIGEELSVNSNSSDYLEVFNSSVPIRENDKSLNLELNDTTSSEIPSYDLKLSLDDEFQTDPTAVFSTKRVSVGSPEVHRLSIQQLFDRFFSRHQGSTPNFSDNTFAEPKRNNSKQPGSIVEIYNEDTHTTESYTLSDDTTTKLQEILDTIEDASIIADRIKLEPTVLEVPFINDTVHDITTEKSEDVNYSTNYIHESTVPNQEQHTGIDIFSELPSTKTTNHEELETRKDTKTTIPVFISTQNMETFSPRPTNSPVSTTTEDLTDQDILEASPTTQIFTTTRNLYDNERVVTGQTDIQSPTYINTKNFHNEDAKQTTAQSTLPPYTSTKNFNNEELETDFDTQPTILIYDFTKNFYDEPKVVADTYPTSVLFDSTAQFYNDGHKKVTEIHPTSFTYTSSRNIFGDDLKKQTEIPSTYPTYITTKYPYTKDEIDTHPTFPSYSTSKNRYSEEFKLSTKPQYVSPQFTTLKELVSEEEFQTQTRPEIKSTTLKATESTNSGVFSKEIGTKPTSSIPTSTRNIDDYSKDGIVGFVPQTSNTQKFRNEELKIFGETEKATPIFSNPEEHSVSFGDLTTELSTQRNLETEENTKVSTRINSKLPSLSYIEKANEKNNTVYSRFPVLTDSVVNVYLPPESRDTDGNKKDFTNVGSIFIGAPLSVGGTDPRKDANYSKPKITQSGGVIFMDPQYTDISTRTQSDTREKTLRDPISVITPMQSTSEEKSDQDINSDRKKGPRIQDSKQSISGQGYKIIPFVAEDAVRNQFGKINSTMIVQQGSTEGVPDMVSDFCFIKGRIYMNGENIGKPDPCETCRCFYGRELCQVQRCPMPSDCIPETVPGFCCPRFTCGNNSTAGEPIKKEQKPSAHVQLAEITTTTRKPDSKENVPLPNNKQEAKFGIRVRTRPTPSTTVSEEHTTEENVEYAKTTIKPNIISVTSTTTTTTTKKPNIIRTITNQKPEIKRTTTQSPVIPDPWGLLKVSGCNIYGKFFNINDQVEILSGPCSHCVCTTNGVECNDIC